MNMKRLLARKMLVGVIGCAGVGVSVMCSAAEPWAGSFVLTPSDMDRVTAGTAASSDAWALANGQSVMTAAGNGTSVATATYQVGQGKIVGYSAGAEGFAVAAAYGGSAPSAQAGANVATELPVPAFLGASTDRTITGPSMQITNKVEWQFGFVTNW
jgi:hypothetical protein